MVSTKIYKKVTDYQNPIEYYIKQQYINNFETLDDIKKLIDEVKIIDDVLTNDDIKMFKKPCLEKINRFRNLPNKNNSKVIKFNLTNIIPVFKKSFDPTESIYLLIDIPIYTHQNFINFIRDITEDVIPPIALNDNMIFNATKSKAKKINLIYLFNDKYYCNLRKLKQTIQLIEKQQL